MLVTPKFKQLPADMSVIFSMLADNKSGISYPIPLDMGIYQCSHWNFEEYLWLPKNSFEFEYPQIVEQDNPHHIGSIGVCDDYPQILEHCPEIQLLQDRYFVISIVSIKRENEPSEGGWRWHKWGEYIGTQNPQHEYLYQDKHIDEVFTYHIYELPEESIASKP